MSKTDEIDDLKKILEGMLGANIGTDQDAMPEGFGEFGHEVTNPIPVHTLLGNIQYLDRLRTANGRGITYERVGSTRTDNIPSMIDVYKIIDGGREIATLFICPYNKKNSERAPRGFILAPASAPTAPAPPEPSGNKPIFFDPPKPAATPPSPKVQTPPSPNYHQQVLDAALRDALNNPARQRAQEQRERHQAQQRPPKQQQSVRPKIWLFSRTGNPVWAVIKYFLWVLALSYGVYALIELQWHLISAPPAGKFLTRLPYMLGMIFLVFTTYGIVGASRVFRRFIFAEFLLFAANMTILLYMVWFRMKLEVVPDTTFERVSYSVIALVLLFYSMFRVSVFIKEGKKRDVLNSSMKRLGGQPQIMFLAYLLRGLIVPFIALGVIWSFRLSLSPGWTAALHIYGFLWACDILRMMFKCLEVHAKSSPRVSRGVTILVMFLHMEIQLWVLPAVGYFLMWYFGWLPMPTWVQWVYGVYSILIVGVGTYGFFIQARDKTL